MKDFFKDKSKGEVLKGLENQIQIVDRGVMEASVSNEKSLYQYLY